MSVAIYPLKQLALVFHGSHQFRAASQWDLLSDDRISYLFYILHSEGYWIRGFVYRLQNILAMVGGWHGQLVARVPKEQKGKQQSRIFFIMINSFVPCVHAMFASSTHERRGIPFAAQPRADGFHG
jgi:hypothetical protein